MSNLPFSQRLGAFKQRFQQVLGNRGSGYDELAVAPAAGRLAVASCWCSWPGHEPGIAFPKCTLQYNARCRLDILATSFAQYAQEAVWPQVKAAGTSA